jgi:hypothetical protein
MRMAAKLKGLSLDDAERMETDWAYTGIPTPNADAVTITTQIAAGVIPSRSDTVMAKLNWTPVERKRIESDWAKQDGLDVLDQALAGLKPGLKPVQKQTQPMDGQQPQALAALNLTRSTDAAIAG